MLVEEHNRQLQQAYDGTRRVAPPVPTAAPSGAPGDVVADLKALAELHRSGALTDAEFSAAKATILGDERRAE